MILTNCLREKKLPFLQFLVITILGNIHLWKFRQTVANQKKTRQGYGQGFESFCAWLDLGARVRDECRERRQISEANVRHTGSRKAWNERESERDQRALRAVLTQSRCYGEWYQGPRMKRSVRSSPTAHTKREGVGTL